MKSEFLAFIEVVVKFFIKNFISFSPQKSVESVTSVRLIESVSLKLYFIWL